MTSHHLAIVVLLVAWTLLDTSTFVLLALLTFVAFVW